MRVGQCKLQMLIIVQSNWGTQTQFQFTRSPNFPVILAKNARHMGRPQKNLWSRYPANYKFEEFSRLDGNKIQRILDHKRVRL